MSGSVSQGHGFVTLADLLGSDDNPNYITTIEYEGRRVIHPDGSASYYYEVDSVSVEVFFGGVRQVHLREGFGEIDTFDRGRLEVLLADKKPQPRTWIEVENSEDEREERAEEAA